MMIALSRDAVSFARPPLLEVCDNSLFLDS